MTHRTFLRAKLHSLRVTSIEATAESYPGAIHVCERLCWPAQLAEGEQIEVSSLSNGARFPATVLVGRVGEVRLPEGDVLGFEPNDAVVFTALASLSAENIAEHIATIVLVDPHRNAAIEIRRPEVRPVLREPSFTPPPGRQEEVISISSATP